MYLSGRRESYVMCRVPGEIAAVSHQVRGLYDIAYVIILTPHLSHSPFASFCLALFDVPARPSDHEANARLSTLSGPMRAEK
jgi:hypothetical protein